MNRETSQTVSAVQTNRFAWVSGRRSPCCFWPAPALSFRIIVAAIAAMIARRRKMRPLIGRQPGQLLPATIGVCMGPCTSASCSDCLAIAIGSSLTAVQHTVKPLFSAMQCCASLRGLAPLARGSGVQRQSPTAAAGTLPSSRWALPCCRWKPAFPFHGLPVDTQCTMHDAGMLWHHCGNSASCAAGWRVLRRRRRCQCWLQPQEQPFPRRLQPPHPPGR